MVPRRLSLVLTILAILSVFPHCAQQKPLSVFPGAEGFGANMVAGRGGAILNVTTLNDSGLGSLRAAIAATGPRIVVFEVSGAISLTSHLEINNPFVTVAGQTAPSPGITLTGAGISVQAHDVLIQHLRIRVGDSLPGPKPKNRDGLQILGPSFNVVVDHCSISWAIDENADAWYEPHDVTFRHCIISEALNDSLHPEGPHSKGLLIGQGSQHIRLIGNLFVHNADRNPAIKDGAAVLLVNNVVYNWGSGSATRLGSSDTEPAAISASVVGNVYIRGVDTPSSAYAIGVSSDADPGTQVYERDNRAEGVEVYKNEASLNPMVSTPPIWLEPLTALPSDSVESWVLANAGARPADRDAIDQRIITEVQTRTGRIIDSQNDVGGWPNLAMNIRPLTPPSDPNGDEDGDGSTNLEEWLHAFTADVAGRETSP